MFCTFLESYVSRKAAATYRSRGSANMFRNLKHVRIRHVSFVGLKPNEREWGVFAVEQAGGRLLQAEPQGKECLLLSTSKQGFRGCF